MRISDWSSDVCSSDLPSITRTRMTTPRYGSYQLSTSIALSGASRSPLGGGIRLTTASSTSVMPIPDLALVSTASDASSPMISSISALRSEEHTSELQSLMRISYAVFFLEKKNIHYKQHT